MHRQFILGWKNAQTLIEYMLLLTAVVSIVLIGFKTYLPRIQQSSNVYFNRAGYGILGDPNRCGDGIQGPFEDREKCCADFGAC